MGNLSGESREQNRKDKVTRFPSVTVCLIARIMSKYSRAQGATLSFAWVSSETHNLQRVFRLI